MPLFIYLMPIVSSVIKTKTKQMKKLIFIAIILIASITGIQAQSESEKANMYFTTQVEGTMEEVLVKLKSELKTEKFGVVTELNMDKTLQEKLGVDMMPYKILGVCSPKHAYQAIQAEENIGVFLPCKMILKQVDEETIEIVAINPAVMMSLLDNPEVTKVGEEVANSMEKVLRNMN